MPTLALAMLEVKQNNIEDPIEYIVSGGGSGSSGSGRGGRRM